MGVEDAAKLIISAGLVYPDGEAAKKALEDGGSASEDKPAEKKKAPEAAE